MPETSQTQGRYTILSAPVASPGNCAICGYSSLDRQYLDMGLHFEWYGTAIFCEECIASMSRLFGYIKPDEALALEAKVEEAHRELVTLRAAVAAMGDFNAAIGSLVGGSVDVAPVASVVLTSTDSDVEDTTDSGTEAESPSDEPISLTRPNDLHSVVARPTGFDFFE